MTAQCLVTVATCGYLPRALAAVTSFARLNPGWDTVVLVADASEAAVRAVQWSGAPGLRAIGIDTLNDSCLAQMRRYFGALEFCCAAKWFLVAHVLFRLGYERAVFLDPDTLCLGSFDRVLDALSRNDVLVTPHSLGPMPDDGELPNDLELATTGYINAGFLAARRGENTRSVLDWLQRKVAELGFFLPAAHLYADQTWISALPWFFPDAVGVLRDPGLNVGYWNLHERTLAFANGRFTSNGVPLVFFHFSGYDTRNPSQLTVHTRRRLSASNEKAVAMVIDAYHRSLMEAIERIPAIRPDFPCSAQSFARRMRAYRTIHGKRPPVPLHFRRTTIQSVASRLWGIAAWLKR